MKRKKMTKRIAAIVLAAVMMIPTHVTSFAADASAQSAAGQENSSTATGTSDTGSGAAAQSGSNEENSAAGNSADTQTGQSNAETNTNANSSASQGSTNSSETNTNANSSASQNSTGSSETNTNTGSSASQSQNSTNSSESTTNSTSGSDTNGNVTGGVTVEDDTKSTENVTGDVIVDENNDDVEIKKDDKPYLALGADLSDDQRNTVLSLMGIDPANLANYDVTYVTNAQEHQYLDSYVDASKIGSKSWSSVVIVKRKKGNGLNISTNNITYCTVGMYKNALTTAGITDADIIVAGPKPISGTAALVGIFEAMTGETVQDNVVDAALNELVVTGELEASIQGLTDQEVEEFIAYIKSLIAEKGLTDEKSINEAIDEACDKYGVTLSDDERQKIVDLLLKITSLGIDLSGLVDYAASLYNSFKNGGSSSGIIASIGTFFGNIFSAIGEFFKNLFK